MKNRSYILALFALVLVISGCSTQKNTWASRTFHEMKVRYNIQYNGNVAYEQGLKSINDANTDDYSQLLNLYPVSNHDAAKSASSNMDRTIEKCRKSIKLHSIKAKPKRDPKRANDPAYRQWLKQEEFNKEMGNVWIRLGEAEFHKGDFLGAIGTFSYVNKHYEYDPDMVARCQLWIARAYGELGWLYEAEDMLSKVNVDALSRKHARLYSAISADILLKTKQYHKAIPFVKIAIPYEKRKIYRPRFQYVLAQLYETEGQNKEAIDSYRKVIRLNPSNEMDFNARIRISQLNGKASLKHLRQMTNQAKNKDRLDQIYGAMGNIYLSEKDTNKALEYYNLAIEKATQPTTQKAAVLLKAGDIYYDRRDYVKAQPCYREAVTILSSDNENFERVQRRSEVLDELIVEYTASQLQDSLQRLGRMSEFEQRAVAEKIVADLKAAEKAEAEKEAQALRDEENGANDLKSVNTSRMLGNGGTAGKWYFYNAQLMRSGKQEFQQKWGSRSLEDNWRRTSKTMMTTFTNNAEDNDTLLLADSTQNDSIQHKVVAETDVHKPEYYLQQIPHTEEDYANSDSLLRHALINMVYIYQDKMEEPQLADETFAELCRRYPGHQDLLDLYYMYYLRALRDSNQQDELLYRQAIVNQYPNSKQAYIVSQPDYFDKLRHMALEQDSLYESTYKAYTKAQYASVKSNKEYAEQNYPLSPLMPRFLFLNAIAVARTEGQPAFVEKLRDMVNRYPESELGAMAKDMLAMMGQGMESQTGGEMSNLADLRSQVTTEEQDTTSTEKQFSAEKNDRSVVLLILPTMDENKLNELQYQVALFNFSQFLIKDFDLQKMPVFGTGCALRVIGFDSLDEADWWTNLVSQNTELSEFLQKNTAKVISITETNLPLLNTTFTSEDYESFIKQSKGDK